MERDGAGRILVAVDSSLLINFLLLGRMDILGQLRAFCFCVVNHVTEEILRAEQRARLQTAVAAGFVQEVEITEPEEILLYDGFRAVLGDGEAACMAIAVRRRWVVAGDEKGRFRRELFDRLGENYLLDTPGVLLTAIRGGVITADEASHLREILRQNRFQMDPRPFDDLLKEE